jgi:hypothetical protein
MKVTDSDICERCEVGPVAGYALAEPGATLMFIALCEKCLDTIEVDWKTGAEKIAQWQNERKLTGGKGDTEAKARKNAEGAVMDADADHLLQPVQAAAN